MVPIAAKNTTAVDFTLTFILNVETLEFLLESFLYILCFIAIFLAQKQVWIPRPILCYIVLNLF